MGSPSGPRVPRSSPLIVTRTAPALPARTTLVRPAARGTRSPASSSRSTSRVPSTTTRTHTRSSATISEGGGPGSENDAAGCEGGTDRCDAGGVDEGADCGPLRDGSSGGFCAGPIRSAPVTMTSATAPAPAMTRERCHDWLANHASSSVATPPPGDRDSFFDAGAAVGIDARLASEASVGVAASVEPGVGATMIGVAPAVVAAPGVTIAAGGTDAETAPLTGGGILGPSDNEALPAS